MGYLDISCLLPSGRDFVRYTNNPRREVNKIPFFDSKRKVQAFGTSLAITLPALFVKGNEIRKGCNANTFFGFDGVLIAAWFDDHNKLKKTLNELIEELDKRNSQNEK